MSTQGIDRKSFAVDAREGRTEYWPDDRLIKLFGIGLTIIQAPMAGSAFSDMAAAVSEAGGLANLAFEVSPFGVRLVCIRTLANVDSRSIQDTMGLISGQLNIAKDQVKAQFEQSNFLRTLATVQDTANAAVLVASDRGRMLTGTVVNVTAGAALD